MKKYHFRFHWLDGKTEEIWARDVQDAFSRLGYGAGAVAALNYFEVIK